MSSLLNYFLNSFNRHGNMKALKYKSYSKTIWEFLSLFYQNFGRIKFVPKVIEKFLKISFDDSKLSSKTPQILSVALKRLYLIVKKILKVKK